MSVVMCNAYYAWCMRMRMRIFFDYAHSEFFRQPHERTAEGSDHSLQKLNRKCYMS